jgi:hypothetical protein
MKARIALDRSSEDILEKKNIVIDDAIEGHIR